MATRKISTVVAIDGEREYRSAISRINSELKNLNSALKLTSSEYKNNANSLVALTAKGQALQDMAKAQAKKVNELKSALDNAKAAVAAYSAKKAELTAKLQANNEALEKLKATTGDTSAQEAKLAAENQKLNDELAKNEGYLQAAEKGVLDWSTRLNEAQVDLNEINEDIRLNDKYLDEAKNSADGCAQSIDEFGNETKDAATSADELNQALAAAGLVVLVAKLTDAFQACAEASIDFETGMAGVAKTTDLTAAELDAMGVSLMEMATQIPLTTTELASIAEVAGQLGIAKEDLLSFTETMANLGVSTNMTSEEAATMLAQFTAITGMDTAFYENLGSTVVALGNNFATNEQRITDMAQAIAASGTIAGMSEAEMLALSASVTSLGITSANGGTQMSKLISEMQTAVETGKNLDTWAQAAGMSAQEFAGLWGTNAVGALQAFIGNLDNLDVSAGVMLDTLGITETRMKTMILSLVNAEESSGMLTSAINLANEAWADNTALAAEAATRYETTESKIQLLENSFENLKIVVGDELTPAIGGLADMGSSLLQGLTSILDENEFLISATASLAASLTVLVSAVTAYNAVMKLAPALTKLFTVALSANPFFLAATAIAAVATGISVLVATTESAVPSVNSLTEETQGLADAMEDAKQSYTETGENIAATSILATMYAEQLQALEESGLKTAESQNQYSAVVAKLNALIPGLNLTISEQTGLIEGGTEALYANISAWEENAKAEAYAAMLKEQITALTTAELELTTNTQALAAAQAEGVAIQQQMNDLQAAGGASSKAYQDEMAALSVDLRNNQREQKNLQTAIDSGNEALAAAEENYSKAKDAIGELSGAAGDAAENVGKIGEKTRDVDFSGMRENLSAALSGLREESEAAGEDVGTGLSSGIDASATLGATSVAEAVQMIIATVRNSLQSHSPSQVMVEIGRGIPEGLAIGMSDSVGTLLGPLASIGQLIITTLTQMGNDSKSGFMTAFSPILPETQTTLGSVVAQMQSSTAEQIPIMTAGGANSKAAFKTGLDPIIPETTGTLSGVSGEMTAAGATQLGIMTTNAVNSANGYVDGITPVVAESSTVFNNMSASIKIILDTLTGSMSGIGSNIVSGLISGIAAKASELYSKVRRVISNAIGAARKAADSHSPSRKMIALGLDMDEGLALGLSAGSSAVSKAAQTVVNHAVNASADISRYIGAIDDRIPTVTTAGSTSLKSSGEATSRRGGDIHVIQNIYAENTSYAQQQRQAAKRLKAVARGI